MWVCYVRISTVYVWSMDILRPVLYESISLAAVSNNPIATGYSPVPSLIKSSKLKSWFSLLNLSLCK